MKGQKLHEWQNKKSEKEEPSLPPVTCHICKKSVGGAYGWHDFPSGYLGSCSAKCESALTKLRENRYVSFPLRANQAAPDNGV